MYIYESTWPFMTNLQVTNVVFLRNHPEEGGYGFSQFATAGAYATPVVSSVTCCSNTSSLNQMIPDICYHWGTRRQIFE